MPLDKDKKKADAALVTIRAAKPARASDGDVEFYIGKFNEAEKGDPAHMAKVTDRGKRLVSALQLFGAPENIGTTTLGRPSRRTFAYLHVDADCPAIEELKDRGIKFPEQKLFREI